MITAIIIIINVKVINKKLLLGRFLLSLLIMLAPVIKSFLSFFFMLEFELFLILLVIFLFFKNKVVLNELLITFLVSIAKIVIVLLGLSNDILVFISSLPLDNMDLIELKL